jgi:hexosaminidase
VRSVGGSTEIGGGPDGFDTQADYFTIVRHTAVRYRRVVAEIDKPGHTGGLGARPDGRNRAGRRPRGKTSAQR